MAFYASHALQLRLLIQVFNVHAWTAYLLSAVRRLATSLSHKTDQDHLSSEETNLSKHDCAKQRFDDILKSMGDAAQPNTKQTQDCECVPSLKVSSNSWVAKMQSRRGRCDRLEDDLSHEDIVRNMKSILNKLTMEKFDTLSKQLIGCGIKTSSHLDALVKEILEKATAQHHFINMYADLCSMLHIHFGSLPMSAENKMKFKEILLKACQDSFERRFAGHDDSEMLQGEDLEVAKQLYKLRMIGSIKFIGALLVRHMLSGKVMFAIIDDLFGDSSEEALECLAALLTVVGPAFDRPECPHQIKLAPVFDRVAARSQDSLMKCRVRCLLRDVLELRSSGWEDRKPKKIEGPSTLQQVASNFHAESKAPFPSRGSPKSENWQGFVKPAVFTMPAANSFQGYVHNAESTKLDAKWLSDRFQVPTPKAESPKLDLNHASWDQSQKAMPEDTRGMQKDDGNLEERLKEFIEANGIDDEGAEDLKARSREVQELVLAKGNVTSARNPSAMLRVRVNQALRELNKTAKNKISAEERARAARKAFDANDPKKESPKMSEQSSIGKGKISEAHCSKGACHKKVTEVYDELMNSRELHEIGACIDAINTPPWGRPNGKA